MHMSFKTLITGLAGSVPAKHKHLTSLATIALASAAVTTPSWAQEAQLRASAETACEVGPVEQRSDSAEATYVLAARCGKTGVNLGTVERHRVFENRADKFLIVELVRAGRTYVYLLAPNKEGPGEEVEVVVENITGSLARLAGRTATSTIDRLELDYSGVEAEGLIAITGERARSITEELLLDETEEVDETGEIDATRRNTSPRAFSASLDVRKAAGKARARKAQMQPAEETRTQEAL